MEKIMSREVQLTLENLKDLDFGKIGVAFNAELAHVTKDCLDRPGDTKARKVAITFILAPTADTIGNGSPADVVQVGCEISSSVPKRRSRWERSSPPQCPRQMRFLRFYGSTCLYSPTWTCGRPWSARWKSFFPTRHLRSRRCPGN